MDISTQNNYQTMNAYQQPPVSTLPVEPPVTTQPVKPTEPPVEELSPEEQLNLDRENQATQDAADAETQAKQDAQREYAAGYVGHKSMQTQVEIYLSVATDSDVDLGNDSMPSILESLRDVQKQNNAVQAYADNQTNQNTATAVFA